MTPTATYRVQFHKGFTFADGARLGPYLRALGISHLYASPIATARSGSMHGYDVVDPTRINPELGGEEGFRSLCAALRAEDVGVIIDIVPNHLAVGGADNAYWLDVLEKGRGSRWADLFDIDWEPEAPELRNKVLAPFLARPYPEALEAGDVVLVRDAAGWAAIAHGAHRFPIRPEDAAALNAEGGGASERFDPKTEAGRAALHELLERQHFRLASWRVAGDAINWRRFFDVTELAGIRAEREEVFELVHALPLRLYAEGLIDGVRADHVDGLADPAGYCARLRGRLEDLDADRPGGKGPAYFVIEKILAPHERLSTAWPVDGTTGYDFMEWVSALQHDPIGAPLLGARWREVSGRSAVFALEERSARREILERSFAGQLGAAARAFAALGRAAPSARELGEETARRALVGLLASFPCYRTYGFGSAPDPHDEGRLNEAVERARPFADPGEIEAMGLIAKIVLGAVGDEAARPLAAEAARRLQQLSAPVSAKAVEDTAFYRYERLLSRTDVGFDPGRFSCSLEEFHERLGRRAEEWPRTLNATATHDHKRGEDVRARLAVLSETPDRWIETSRRWAELNADRGQGVDPADAYVLYQMLAGALPLDLRADDAGGLSAFADRLGGWFRKALREAKLRTSWTAPDEAYEARCLDLLKALLDPTRAADFLKELFDFVRDLAAPGALNALVQTHLRCYAPGVPDTYQGCEFYDFSLVDPDNRRPVDFDARSRALSEGASGERRPSDWRDGRLKQALLREALRLRRTNPALFLEGRYEPLRLEGPRAENVLAFLRTGGGETLLVAAPVRCAAALWGRAEAQFEEGFWGDTAVLAPSGRSLDGQDRFRVEDLLRERPVAALRLPAA